MYCKGGNKPGINSGETSWRSYSKSLIIELKEKLADRRARTLALLSENGDLTAFNEIDTESDGLEDTSTNATNNEDVPAKKEARQHGEVGEMNSLSDTSSLTGSDYNDLDIRNDGLKHSPGASNCAHSHCCSQSCSTITSVSGRSYTSEDVSSRSLDDFVADANLADGSKGRSHQCPHSVDVRCSLCLIETKIQDKYFSAETAAEHEYLIVRQRRNRVQHSRRFPTPSLYCKEVAPPWFVSHKSDIKARSDTCLCVALQSVAVHVDPHSASAGVLIVAAQTGMCNPTTDRESTRSSNSMKSLSEGDVENTSKSSDEVSDKVGTISNDLGKGNTDSLHDYYLEVEADNDDEYVLEDVTCDEGEEKEDVVSKKDNMKVVNKSREEESKRDTEEHMEENSDGIPELRIEKTEVDKQETWKEGNKEESRTLVQTELQLVDNLNYEEQHADDELYEEQRLTEVEGENEVNELIDDCTYTQDIDCTPETELACDNIQEGSAMITVKDEQFASSKSLNSCELDFYITDDTLHDQKYRSFDIQDTDHTSFSHMKIMLNELVRIFECNTEFYKALNKSIVDRFENHYADFNMLFAAYENTSGNSGYAQSSKSISGAPDPQTEASSSNPADVAAKLNDQNRSLQICLEKARLANTLQGKVGQMRSMATNVAAVKAYEQTVADLEKTMMDYLQVYAKEAFGGVSDKLSKHQQTISIPNENSHDTTEENTGSILRRSETFVLKETFATKPPNSAKRRDGVSTAMTLSAKPKAFSKDIEEEINGSKSEEFQNVPHPSPTFLVEEDNKTISNNILEFSEHSLIKTNRLVADSGVKRKVKKPLQTMKGLSCLVIDQDFDSDTSDSLSEVKEAGNLTYTSSLLTQLLDYNSPDESKIVKEKAISDERLEFAGIDLENNLAACSELLESSGSLKQHTASKSKNKKKFKWNSGSQNTVTSNVLPKSLWISLDDDDHNFEAFDYKTDLDNDTKIIDTSSEHFPSESLKGPEKHVPLQQCGIRVKIDEGDESISAQGMQDLADTNIVSPANGHFNSQANSKIFTDALRHEFISLSESVSTATDKRVNKQKKSLLDDCLHEDIANETSCSKANETVVASKQVSGRSRKQYSLGQQPHKQWQLPEEVKQEIIGKKKQDMLLSKIDWSSSDDEAVDDVPRDVSPSNLLKQKQKRDVDDQLEHLSQYYRRSRKSRSPLRRTVSSNISRWIDDVQGASMDRTPSDILDFFSDSFTMPFRQNDYGALSGEPNFDMSKFYNIHEDSDNAVFVSPSQLLEARNQEEQYVTEEGESNIKLNEQIHNTDNIPRSTILKEDQVETHSRGEGSKRSWSISSTSDEYVLSDRRSIQVNTSTDNLVCIASEDIATMRDITNLELEQAQAHNLFNDPCAEACVPKASPASSYFSSTGHIDQSSTVTIEEGLEPHQAALTTSIHNQSLHLIKAGSNDRDGSLAELAVVECPLLTGSTAIETSNVDFPHQYDRGTSTGKTLSETGIKCAIGADVPGDGVHDGLLHNYRTNKLHRDNQTSVGSDSMCPEIKISSIASKDVLHVDSVGVEQNTSQTHQTSARGKVLNKSTRNNDRSFSESQSREACREGRTDVSAIRERWEMREDGRNVDTCIEPERKLPFKKIAHQSAHQNAGFSNGNKPQGENITSHSAGRKILPAKREKDQKAISPEPPLLRTTIDANEQFNRQDSDLLTEYQAIDALRYKVNRLEQMLQQSDINTANFHQRNSIARENETMVASEKITSCPHCQNSGSANSLSHTQPLPEHGHGSHTCCLSYTNDREYFNQSESWNLCQVCLSHGPCVHLEGWPLSLDKKHPKHYDSKSSKACQTSHDTQLTPKSETRVDASTQCQAPENTPDAGSISLEQRLTTMDEDMQEMKRFASSASTLMVELDERWKSLSALTSTSLTAYSKQMEDTQIFISGELKQIQDSLQDQNDISKLVREYVAVAEKNSETALETIRAHHQDVMAKTPQWEAVEEALPPMRECLVAHKKEFEDIKSSLERVLSMLSDKRPEQNKKGMNYESMKERVVELTSQRDAEKVFHRITRQALRALEKDHDRLRQEYVRATCRRYNNNESEAQKRLWYYLNNEDKCPHNKNHSNMRATRQLHEVWSPRRSSTDGDSSSSSCRHGQCPHGHTHEADFSRFPQCGYTAVDARNEWEYTTSKQVSPGVVRCTDIWKCASKAGSYSVRSADSHGSQELFEHHNAAAITAMKSPKKVSETHRKKVAEQHLGVVSIAHELSVHLPQANKRQPCKGVTRFTPTMSKGELLDEVADVSKQEIVSKSAGPRGTKNNL